MDREKAENIIKEWADWLEVDKDRNYFKYIIEQLSLPVMNDRLTFDMDSEIFKYKLIKPIMKRDDSGSIDILEIKETDMNENKVVQKFQENETVDQSEAMLSKCCGIESGFVSRIKQRDMRNLMAVILGFFAQADSEKK